MNRRSTALIVILSLLAIFVTNTLAQTETTEDPNLAPKVPGPEPEKDLKTDQQTVPEPKNTDGPPAGEPAGTEVPLEGSTGSGATYPVIGAIATAVIANFF
ncbi:unnamed protein product [Caenorhabditis nigoni]